eukprot:354140-Chlamydomonas_euryale.AAC.6
MAHATPRPQAGAPSGRFRPTAAGKLVDAAGVGNALGALPLGAGAAVAGARRIVHWKGIRDVDSRRIGRLTTHPTINAAGLWTVGYKEEADAVMALSRMR